MAKNSSPASSRSTERADRWKSVAPVGPALQRAAVAGRVGNLKSGSPTGCWSSGGAPIKPSGAPAVKIAVPPRRGFETWRLGAASPCFAFTSTLAARGSRDSLLSAHPFLFHIQVDRLVLQCRQSHALSVLVIIQLAAFCGIMRDALPVLRGDRLGGARLLAAAQYLANTSLTQIIVPSRGSMA